MAVPGQVVVKLQCSHNLGDVSGPNLQTLLDRISAYKGYSLQWTLSAPIQSCISTQSSTIETSSGEPSKIVSAAAATNLFCMTNPAPFCGGEWPKCVVGKATDTILVDYWFSAASVSIDFEFISLDTFVKKIILDWVKNTLKFPKHIWIASHFSENLTSSVHVKHDKVEETKTINKVMSQGYD